MKRLLQKIVRGLAMKYGCFPGLYRRFCRPRDEEWANFLSRHGHFEAIGRDCSIVPTAVITDPPLVRMGNNVRLAACALIAHDGVIGMLNKAYGVNLDSVGRIDIRDNVFIGYGAIVLPNVRIGPNAVVAAGAVVIRDVEPGDIVAGVPAKPIGKVSQLLEKLSAQTDQYPWANLIKQRNGAFDAALEPELMERRIAHFWRRPEAASTGFSS
jgi:acetyltransferase-like isoleucine patch superfamily enzyme